jgi:DnaK suppressor protein
MRFRHVSLVAAGFRGGFLFDFSTAAGYTMESAPVCLSPEHVQLLGMGMRLIVYPASRVSESEMNINNKNGPKLKLSTYRQLLERKAEEVRGSMSAQKAAQVVARLDVPSDEGDLSQQHHEEWIFLNRNTIDMKLLREISDALRRLENRTYGVCPECENPISTKRLDAVPWARYCVTCQERIADRLAHGEEVDEYQEA